jgi:CBS domain-containing protein
MKIGKICSRPARSTNGTVTVRRAAVEMLAHHVGALVVLDEDGKPAGFVTDRDIVIRCLARDYDPDVMVVTEIMSEPLETVYEEEPVEVALQMMADREVRRLIVKDVTGALIGVLSFDDVLDFFADESSEIGRLLERRQPV